MEIENYKERINKRNEIQLAAILIVLIETIQNTKKAINTIKKDGAIETKYYFLGKLNAINDILDTIDTII